MIVARQLLPSCAVAGPTTVGLPTCHIPLETDQVTGSPLSNPSVNACAWTRPIIARKNSKAASSELSSAAIRETPLILMPGAEDWPFGPACKGLADDAICRFGSRPGFM